MKIYAVSDTHFGHKKLTEWEQRPADFEERLFKGLRTIPDDAVLIHCGDLALGGDVIASEFFRSMKFKKWLIRGNHDNHSTNWYLNHGWDSVFDEAVLVLEKKRVLFSHPPLPKRIDIDFNVHGHMHGGKRGYPDFYDKEYHKEVCPEVIGYLPAKIGN